MFNYQSKLDYQLNIISNGSNIILNNKI